MGCNICVLCKSRLRDKIKRSMVYIIQPVGTQMKKNLCYTDYASGNLINQTDTNLRCKCHGKLNKSDENSAVLLKRNRIR